MNSLKPNNENLGDKRYQYTIILGVLMVLMFCFSFRSYFISELFSNAVLLFREIPFHSGTIIYLIIGIFAIISQVFILKNTSSSDFTNKVDYFDLTFLTYVLWSTISVFWSIDKGIALGASMILWSTFLFYQIFKNIYQTHQDTLDKLFRFLLPLGVIAFTIIYLVHNSDLIASLGDTSMSYKKYGSITQSTVGDKKVSAIFLCLVLPLILIFLRKDKTSEMGIYSMLLSVFMILILGYRATFFILFVFFASMLLVSKPEIKRVILFFVLTLVIFLVYFQFVDINDFAKSLSRNTISQRLVYWQRSISLFYEVPIWGQGLGQWDILKNSVGLKERITHPHSDYLRNLVELGIVGFTLYISLILTMLYRSLKLAFSTKERNERSLYALYVAGILSYMTLVFLDEMMFKINHQVLFMIMCVLINKQYNESFTSNGLALNTKVLPIAILVAAVGLLLFIIF